MGDDGFRDRVLREIEASNKKLAEIARESGVSYNVLTKMKAREGSSTSAENAEKLSRYFGWEEPAQSGYQGSKQSQPTPDSPQPAPTFVVRGRTVEVRAILDRDEIDRFIGQLGKVRDILDD